MTSHTAALASLIAELSEQDLLRGDPYDLLVQAQADPTFGAGFQRLPYVSRDRGDKVNFALLQHTDFILLVFPGSKLLQNWTSRTGNFSVRRVRQLGGKVHKGFWAQVDTYWGELGGRLARCDALPVVLGGHSRGGACAVIAALRVEQQLGTQRLGAVITLGQPACVNFALARHIGRAWGARYVRVVTSTDVIPLAPTWPWYSRAGELWFIRKDCTRLVNPSKDDIEEAVRADNPIMRSQRSLPRFLLAVRKQAIRVREGHDLGTYRDCLYGT